MLRSFARQRDLVAATAATNFVDRATGAARSFAAPPSTLPFAGRTGSNAAGEDDLAAFATSPDNTLLSNVATGPDSSSNDATSVAHSATSSFAL